MGKGPATVVGQGGFSEEITMKPGGDRQDEKEPAMWKQEEEQ
jgi:hypothetical protein